MQASQPSKNLPNNHIETNLGTAWASVEWAQKNAGLSFSENAIASLKVDLDEQLHFGKAALIVTAQKLVSIRHNAHTHRDEVVHFQIMPDQSLRLSDHAGIGTLELIDREQQLGVWRFTLKNTPAAQKLIKAFEWAQESKSSEDLFQPFEEENPAWGQEAPTIPSTWVLFRLWRFARPYRGPLLTGFLLMLLATAATLIPPYLTIPLMDDILIPFQNGQPINSEKVGLYLFGLLGAALLAWGLGWAKTYLLAWVSERIGADLRTTTFEHLLGLSLDYFGGKRTGDLIARIGSETDRICVFLSLHALDFATDVLMILMTAAILFSIDPWLALVTLAPLPLIGWMIHWVRDRLRTGFEKIDRVWSEVTNVLADTIPGIRVVKAFAQENRESSRFRHANMHNLEVNDKLNRTWSLFSPTVSLLTEVGLLVVWGFGIWQVSQQHISVGVLTAFIAYIGRFYGRLDSMSRIVSVTQKAAAGAKRVFDILDHSSSVPEPIQAVPLGPTKGEIILSQMGFRYGNRRVIQDLDLTIQPGEMIGLVGHSGSGKSTLVNLICRFYDVTEGSIKLDGTDIRRFSVQGYRSHIGLVLQEPFLFFGTVAENIAYGCPHASPEDIIAAARAAHAHEFILRLPNGYDSLVGERGQGLSGGERQRISIARALLINPRILILDEATASVDTETEQEIQKALDNLVQGRTTIAIAHRLSTLRKANRLVVMDRGRIVEVGSHDALMAQQGHYWRLYQAQARGTESTEMIERSALMTPSPQAPSAHTTRP